MILPEWVIKEAVELSKQWVEYTKQQCAEKAVAKENPADYGTGEIWVDKESILNVVKSQEVI